MKIRFISEFINTKHPIEVFNIYRWLKYRRNQGKIIFLDIVDSTGSIQAIVEKNKTSDELFNLICKTPLESAIYIEGSLIVKKPHPNEINVNSFNMIGKATLQLDPQPRSDFDPFN